MQAAITRRGDNLFAVSTDITLSDCTLWADDSMEIRAGGSMRQTKGLHFAPPLSLVLQGDKLRTVSELSVGESASLTFTCGG